jgi:hypothetical protein
MNTCDNTTSPSWIFTSHIPNVQKQISSDVTAKILKQFSSVMFKILDYNIWKLYCDVVTNYCSLSLITPVFHYWSSFALNRTQAVWYGVLIPFQSVSRPVRVIPLCLSPSLRLVLSLCWIMATVRVKASQLCHDAPRFPSYVVTVRYRRKS